MSDILMPADMGLCDSGCTAAWAGSLEGTSTVIIASMPAHIASLPCILSCMAVRMCLRHLVTKTSPMLMGRCLPCQAWMADSDSLHHVALVAGSLPQKVIAPSMTTWHRINTHDVDLHFLDKGPLSTRQ